MQTMSFTPGVGRFHHRVGGEHRRHVDDRRVRAGRCNGVGHGVEDRNRALELLAAFARRDTADDFVPYSIICFVWNEPSRPVMPCTITVCSLSMKMLMRPPPSSPSCNGLLHRFVHVRHRREAVLLQNLHGDLFVGSGEPNDDRHLERILLRRGHDAVRDVIGARDAAEDVEQNRLHVRIGGDDA